VKKTTAKIDVAVVGGGPAGLAAALAAARMNRRAVCFEAGTPRTAHAPHYHNVLGFPRGISGEALLRVSREQVAQWGAEIRDAEVLVVRHAGDGFVLDIGGADPVEARGIVFATGVYDNQPSCGSLYSQTGRGIHYCVVCDGYETRGQRVAVIGRDDDALDTLAALRDFTDDLHLVLEKGAVLGTAVQASLVAGGVQVHEGPVGSCMSGEDGVRFELAGGRELVVAHVFLALGVTPKTELAAELGCELDEEGYIVTDPSLATTIPFVYAAGDCNGGRKQVTQAMAARPRRPIRIQRSWSTTRVIMEAQRWREQPTRAT
jgi:thioredoxin reductase (NADPH)